ncbi:Armadillo-type fold protein [Cordyceps fumosorosea ARSEF 2679]|uniref:Armadillo-type fold protein n=1 Tax=Cordyceps fumosorosea (strain ARSEF 2679) TaxID=1081104 RepID=A0A168ETE6_CORFA|nr:Armadillo-type fold protein [Cordyceps fumosorosea ARSEF 2679]OAA74197.1 Armadillo-type fold protein [Cordyceps fumosorosea ARSEF 2679]
MAPSQPLPLDPAQEPHSQSKYSAATSRSVSRLDEDDRSWEHTIRLVSPEPVLSPPTLGHSRDSSTEKLPRLQPTLTSPRSATGASARHNIDASRVAAYGHHRQTSIVHGIQHSRNGSIASSASSPLSPQMIAAAGVGLDMDSVGARMDSVATATPSTAAGSTSSAAMEKSVSATDASAFSATQRKVDQIHPKSRRDHAPHHSHSSRHRDDQKTVGEYALHVLFTSFIAQAEEKLNECITVPFDPEPSVDQICGPGVDPAFDQLIVALGHIASPKPKALIDSMMLWRKSKSDAANDARSQLQQLRNHTPGTPLLRRNTEPAGISPADNAFPTGVSLGAKQEYVAQQERRSTVSIYILCRVLVEVICQSSLASITPEMEDKLESIIFGQLKIADTEQLAISPLKMANWNLFAQLLGYMSEINFVGITRRFVEDLGACLQERTVRSPTSISGREVEGKIELVLNGMKHLRIKVSPEESWEQSCDFLIKLGRLFSKSHGQRVKSAFCHVLDMLLRPVAAKALNSHLMQAKWADVLSAIGPRLAQMHLKPRHWAVSFPLTATLLCVSPPENFTSQWLLQIMPLQTKIKDRFTKPLCLQVISRLVWTYLYRTNDSQMSAARKLDDVIRLVMPSSKRSLIAADAAVTEPLIQLIRIIGFKYPEFCFKNIIFPLINAENFLQNKDLKVEQLDPDRIVIGIRAFLSIMSDLEKGEQGRPPFPQTFEAVSNLDRFSTSPIMSTKPRSPTSPAAPPKKDTVSRPVLTSVLTDGVREYYFKFCQVLGKIAVVCDNTFGGQATLDEKFNSPGPKTPISESFTFSRKDDVQTAQDQRQAFYELLHVAVQALPRCLGPGVQLNTLINVLCTGTAHVQFQIADSSADSLKAIAKHSLAQQVTMGFARFIFNFDDRYSTMSDGGMLGPGHIENTLRIYVELMQIWIEEIRQKMRDAASGQGDGKGADQRALQLDLSQVWGEVDQAEAHGLFFLCSQSRRVRHFAITVLKLITEFDKALGKDTSGEKDTLRLIDILENDSIQVMNFNEEGLSLAEKSRLQRGLQNTNSKGAVVELCTSDISYDATLWFKIVPNLIRIFFERCPFAVTICRDLICNRIIQMYKAIVLLSEPSRSLLYGGESGNQRLGNRSAAAHPEVMVEQWKLYLIFACTTMADPGALPAPANPKDRQHSRRGSRHTSTDKIVTARTLFKYLIPLLSVSSASVREAVVVAMGSINIHIYRCLLEELQGQVARCNDEARARIHQRTNSSPRRNRKMDLLRTEITHVFKLTSHFLRDERVYHNEFFLTTLTTYAKDLKLFLMDGEVQMDWEFQKLRQHYCGLMESLFDGINRSKDPSRWMTFESRKSAFSLMEDWCGFSPNQNQIRAREDSMRQSIIDQQTLGERGTVTAAMEIEKRNLRNAALSAMAALCAGPVTFTTESGVTLQFDVRRMLAWVEGIFNSGSDRMNVTGRLALKNLVIHNRDYPYLLGRCIARCYLADAPKVLESYFMVTVDVLQECPEYPCPFWKMLSLCLFTLGNEQSEIRSKSAAALRSLEIRQQRNSKIRDFDISIADKTQAVYKLAQFEISKRLAMSYTELAFHIVSELTYYFKDLQPAAQRNVVAVILPWIQAIELKLDPNGGPTAQSYVLLANLLEITIKSSGALHHEVQALWQALATGPHPGNVRLVLDFIMQLCLERREQNFVEYAKQIVVFLSTTSGTPGIKVVEFLLLQITPKAMVPNEKRNSIPPPPDVSAFPYCADLNEALPVGTKQAGFSLGQLSLILLVDLMVAPVNLSPESIPSLLHVVAVLWDHYTPLVQEQAREMLVHLIHELVLSRMDETLHDSRKQAIEELIDLVRGHDRAVVWSYEDSNGKVDEQDNKVPPSMEYLTAEVLQTFEPAYPGIKEQWGRLSLTWATSCPVRHLACRSFQIFRCVLTSLDQYMLGDMLARLSNTIADEDPEIQSFSMEILTTLKTLIVKLESDKLLTFPQLFWTTCACLDSINEREFGEAVDMLSELVRKTDLRSANVRRLIADGQPSRWDGAFDGLQPLLHKGLRSAVCWQPTLDIMEQLVMLPNDPLIGDDQRLFFTLLANFPRFLDDLEQRTVPSDDVLRSARVLFAEADRQGLEGIAQVMDDYVNGEYHGGGDLLMPLFQALKEYYLPRLDFKMITFLLGLLTNSITWVKVHAMRILCVAIPAVDMRNPELAGHGSDLISPLLRLLQTDLCMNALEVLDNIMTVSGSHMDKHHLRMSMTRATSKVIRKEYERTQSLFGIPEASGWAIPVPAKKTEATRANIHAAFYMCQSAEGSSTEATPTAEVEFHNDDFAYGYFEAPERTATMLSDDGRADTLVGDLVTKLDSLDDFFDEPSSPHTDDDGRSSRTVTEYHPDAFDSETQLYDEQILPILHQASNNTSFQNGFADRPPAMSREASANAMNPGAFNIMTSPRPGLHSRSITSPSAPASYHPHLAGEITSDEEYLSGGVSDADDERPNAAPNIGSVFFLENMVNRPPPKSEVITTATATPTGALNSPNLRRLTSRSRDEHRGREKTPPQPAPKMPTTNPSMFAGGQQDLL